MVDGTTLTTGAPIDSGTPLMKATARDLQPGVRTETGGGAAAGTVIMSIVVVATDIRAPWPRVSTSITSAKAFNEGIRMVRIASIGTNTTGITSTEATTAVT